MLGSRANSGLEKSQLLGMNGPYSFFMVSLIIPRILGTACFAVLSLLLWVYHVTSLIIIQTTFRHINTYLLCPAQLTRSPELLGLEMQEFMAWLVLPLPLSLTLQRRWMLCQFSFCTKRRHQAGSICPFVITYFLLVWFSDQFWTILRFYPWSFRECRWAGGS